MKSLTAIVDKSDARARRFTAISLDCNISAIGDDPQDATDKLVTLLQVHVNEAQSRKINPFIGSVSGYEKLGKYYSKHRKDPPEVASSCGSYTLHVYNLY